MINGDGTAAVCQWDRREDVVSWRPWDTDGTFSSIYQCFGKVHAVVDRVINSNAVRLRERFETGLAMDCVAAVKISPSFPEGEAGVDFDQGVTAFATHLQGHVATVFLDGWDLGDNPIGASGKPEDGNGQVITYPDYTGIAQIGLIFVKSVLPWPRRSVRTQSGTREVKRLISLLVTVQDTTAFQMDSQTLGAYRAGEDLTMPPPRRNEQFRKVFNGKTGAETVPITQERPGFLRISKLGYRVVI